MGTICDLYDGWEYYVARAELEYSKKHITAALNEAKLAQKYAKNYPDKFENEIEHLYSIIDTIHPKQSK